jgi:hypothetical protein
MRRNKSARIQKLTLARNRIRYISQLVTIDKDPRTYSLSGTYWYLIVRTGTTIGEQTEHACVHGFLAGKETFEDSRLASALEVRSS